MGISLTINAVNFVLLIYKNCSELMNRGRNNPESTDQRSETYSTMFMYIKLFGGMGLLWFFEIIGSLINSDEENFYVFDILNMLQGFYIFVVHVCKPNVIDIIKDRINGRQFHGLVDEIPLANVSQSQTSLPSSDIQQLQLR